MCTVCVVLGANIYIHNCVYTCFVCLVLLINLFVMLHNIMFVCPIYMMSLQGCKDIKILVGAVKYIVYLHLQMYIHVYMCETFRMTRMQILAYIA